jgi:hypothetical protein
MIPRKIDIVVHGRFYAFDLARELIALGHDIVVYTNYPPLCRRKVRSSCISGALVSESWDS